MGIISREGKDLGKVKRAYFRKKIKALPSSFRVNRLMRQFKKDTDVLENMREFDIDDFLSEDPRLTKDEGKLLYYKVQLWAWRKDSR